MPNDRGLADARRHRLQKEQAVLTLTEDSPSQSPMDGLERGKLSMLNLETLRSFFATFLSSTKIRRLIQTAALFLRFEYQP
jgi:hypothetical protein